MTRAHPAPRSPSNRAAATGLGTIRRIAARGPLLSGVVAIGVAVAGVVRGSSTLYLAAIGIGVLAVAFAVMTHGLGRRWLAVAVVGALVAVVAPMAQASAVRDRRSGSVDEVDLDARTDSSWVIGDRLYVARGISPLGDLTVYDATTLELLASIDGSRFELSAGPVAVVAEDSLVGSITGFSVDGEAVWTYERNGWPIAAFADGTVVLMVCDRDSNCQQTAIEPDGTVRWTVENLERARWAERGRDLGFADVRRAPLLPRQLVSVVIDEDDGTAGRVFIVDEQTGAVRDLGDGIAVASGDEFVAIVRHAPAGCEAELVAADGATIGVAPIECGANGRIVGDRAVFAHAAETVILDGLTGETVRLGGDGDGIEVFASGHAETTGEGWALYADAIEDDGGGIHGGWEWLHDASGDAVVVSRLIGSRNPFVTDDIREVSVVDLGSGERCASVRVAATPYPQVVALEGCRALVVAETLGGAPTTWQLGPR